MSALLEPSLDTFVSLCEDRANESRHLEFKAVQPGKSDKDKFEFAKDVSAFANGEGGALIVGLEDDEGAAKRLKPITNETSDALLRRLGQVLDALLEPRLATIDMFTIEVPEGGFILLIRVGASFQRPHRINQGSKCRFVIREGAYVRDMTYEELGSAFKGLDQAISSLRVFRENRAHDVERGAGPTTIDAHIQCLVHTIPLGAYSGGNRFDLGAAEKRWPHFQGHGWGGASHSFNFDGLLVYCSGASAGEMFEFKQIHRNGLIEACIRACSPWDDYRHIIPAAHLCDEIRSAVNSARAEYAQQDMGGGMVIFVSLIGTADKELGIGERFPGTSSRKSDRNKLLLPEVLVRDLQSDERTEAALRFVFDVIWQSFGWSYCTYYDAEGKWSPPRR